MQAIESCWKQNPDDRPLTGDVASELRGLLHQHLLPPSQSSSNAVLRKLPWRLPPEIVNDKSLKSDDRSSGACSLLMSCGHYHLPFCHVVTRFKKKFRLLDIDPKTSPAAAEFLRRWVGKAASSLHQASNASELQSVVSATLLHHKDRVFTRFVTCSEELGCRLENIDSGPFKPNWKDALLKRSAGVEFQQTADMLQWRQGVMDHLNSLPNVLDEIPFPAGAKVPSNIRLSIVFRGVSKKESAFKQCHTGFSALSVLDPGSCGMAHAVACHFAARSKRKRDSCSILFFY